MDLATLHGYLLGFVIIGSWVVVFLWGLGLWLLRRSEEAPAYWRAVSVAQILLAIQLVVGLVLLVMGRRPGPPENQGGLTLLFHLSYALFSPLVVLIFAHRFARDGRWNPYAIFALVGLVNFGLTFRAWTVGIFGS